MAPKLLEQKFSAVDTVVPRANESTGDTRYPAVCRTVPHKHCPYKMSVVPEEKQCRRALAGEGVESSSRLGGHKHEMIRSRHMLRLKEKDGIVREGQAGKACVLVS